MSQIIKPCTSREVIRSILPGDLITLKHVAIWDSQVETWTFRDDLCLVLDVSLGVITCWSQTPYEAPHDGSDNPPTISHKIVFAEDSWLTDELKIVAKG